MEFLYNDEIKEISGQVENLNMISDYGNAFHSLEMYNFYKKVDKHEPVFIAACDDDKNLKAMVLAVIQFEKGIKKFFSSRAIVFSGPVLEPNSARQYLKPLLLELKKQIKDQSIYIEIRNFNDYNKYHDIYDELGFNYKEHLNFHINCAPDVDLFKNMSSSRRRNIRKSLKKGAKIIEPSGYEELREFYNILKTLYEEKIKKPLPEFDYFKTFYDMDIGEYFLVSYKDEILGGIMCPVLEGKVIYEAYIAGKDRKYKKIHPSVLATYAAMKYAKENNIPVLDLMGAGSPDEDYGVREFKSRFGGKLVEHGRYHKTNKPLLYSLGKLVVNIKNII